MSRSRDVSGIARLAASGAMVANLALSGAMPAQASAPVRSVSFVVSSTADANDAHPGDGICADSAGQCTLRAAVEEASDEARGTSAVITLVAGTYELTLGSLDFSANAVTVDGPSAPSAMIESDGTARIGRVGAGAAVTLEGLTLKGGNAGNSGYGGALWNAGSLTVISSVVRANTAVAGGGIANAGGSLSVVDSLVTGNDGAYYGGGGIQNGGLRNLPGQVTVIGSRITGNVSGGDGGGILNGQNGHPDGPGMPAEKPTRWLRAVHGRRLELSPARDLVVSVQDSRIDGDTSDNSGGGIANDGGILAVNETTLDHDSATDAIGGGISTYGPLVLTGSSLLYDRACYGGGIEAFYGGTEESISVNTALFERDSACVGGAIDDSVPSIDLSASTLDANSAPLGAAIEVEGGSAVSAINSTFVANTGGDALQTYECASASISYSTFSANDTALGASCPDVTLTATIVAGSTSGTNCAGSTPTETVGYNLDSGTTCGFSRNTDLSGTDPLLGELGMHGGPTPTVGLRLGSPAIDHGGTPATGCPATDQRGFARPWGPACDIGALEKHYPLQGAVRPPL